MRLIYTLHDQHRAQGFSHFLTQEGIANSFQSSEKSDGEVVYQIWVVEEDDLDRAMNFVKELEDHPNDSRFLNYPTRQVPTPPPIPANLQEEPRRKPLKFKSRGGPPRRSSRMGIVTGLILGLCLALYTWSVASVAPLQNDPTPHRATNPVWAKLLIDYPEKTELRDELYTTYNTKWLEKPTALTPEGKALLLKYSRTKQWPGAYTEVLKQRAANIEINAPLFEKVGKGEFWRLFSPALLHGHFWHILFNMLWLLILGSQIENRLGSFRYVLFVLLSGVGSCVAQYLMGGYNFVGYSGVVCGMIGFIWMRQRIAAWEGYLLHPNSIALVTVFVVGLALLQSYSFYQEWTTGQGLPSVMANTAHISGGLIGIFLGRLPFFAWQNR